MNVPDVFSGIGRFAVGLTRTGLRAVAVCESDPFARATLARAWPAVPTDCDIAEPSATRLRLGAVLRAKILRGGFPSQDFSVAGGGSLLPGEQSAPWCNMLLLVQACRSD